MSETEFGSLGEPLDRTQVRVRMAARALGNNDLGHAFGHVSARIDADHFLVCAPKPMGLIKPRDAGTLVAIDGPLPGGVLNLLPARRHEHARVANPLVVRREGRGETIG